VGSRAHQLEMIRALNTMDLRPVIDMTYSFAKIVEAFQFQESSSILAKSAFSTDALSSACHVKGIVVPEI
jgi:hypothetical protein